MDNSICYQLRNPRKKIKNLILFFIVFVSFILGSESNSIEATSMSDTELRNYFPLSIGNRWSFYTIANINGMEAPILENWNIEKDTVINNKKYFIFNSSFFQLIRMDKNHLYIIDDNMEIPLLNFSVQNSSSYQAVHYLLYVSIDSLFIINKKIESIQYKYINDSTSCSIWIANGYGPVAFRKFKSIYKLYNFNINSASNSNK